MVRELNGAELVGFIKERQAKQVRQLRQAMGVVPRLMIIKSPGAGAVIESYVRLKQRYAEDILIETEVITCTEAEMPAVFARCNTDESIQGIIVQLPLDDPSQTDMVVAQIAPGKDVDGLGPDAAFPSATADAVNWLVAGYGIDLAGKAIAIVGHGRLVGAPLAAMWRHSGYNVTVIEHDSVNRHEQLLASDIIVSAAGAPQSVTSDDIKSGAVVIDAGTTSDNGQIVGDVDASVRERDDVIITPERGGVGPLTIALLFDHLIQACQSS